MRRVKKAMRGRNGTKEFREVLGRKRERGREGGREGGRKEEEESRGVMPRKRGGEIKTRMSELGMKCSSCRNRIVENRSKKRNKPTLITHSTPSAASHCISISHDLLNIKYNIKHQITFLLFFFSFLLLLFFIFVFLLSS